MRLLIACALALAFAVAASGCAPAPSFEAPAALEQEAPVVPAMPDCVTDYECEVGHD